jgi:hypothetical protein
MTSTTRRLPIANPAPPTPARNRRGFWRNEGRSRVGRCIVAGAGLGVAAALSIAASASADPKTEPIQIACDNGTTYWAVANGHGVFTPAHDVDSTTILNATSFGEFHGVVSDSNGSVLDEFTDPAVAKGSSTKPRATSISCTYVIVAHFDDPDLGPLTFTGTGTVEGFVTPAR